MPLPQLAEPVAPDDVQTYKRFHLTEHEHGSISQLPAVHDVQAAELSEG